MSGDLENELATLCHRFFDPPYEDKTPDNISAFFNRLIKDHQKVNITNDIRYFIPQLASYGNGRFAPMLDPCIEGLSPMHYVPDLQLNSSFMPTYDSDFQEQQIETDRNEVSSVKKPKEPSGPNTNTFSRIHSARSQKPQSNTQTFRVIHTSRSVQRRPKAPLSISELNPGLQLTLPRTARTAHSARTMSVDRPGSAKIDRFKFRKQLPPLKENQDHIMSAIYIRDNPNFFTGKMMKPKSREISIMPPDYPQYLIGNSFEILSSSGIINVSGSTAKVTSLPQFVLDNSNEFIVKQIFMNSKYSKYFFIWRDLFREKRFRRIVTNFDKLDIISRPLFSDLIDKIRDRILTNTKTLNIFPSGFDDGVNDVKFDEFQTVSNKSIMDMENIIISICTTTEKELSEFFRQVRATNLQMQLDFEELHSLNLLPPSLEGYSSDLKWRSQSLTREKERNKLLQKERKFAFHRQNYLGKFFIRIRSVYNGNLLRQCNRCMLSFLTRFSKNYVNIVIEEEEIDKEPTKQKSPKPPPPKVKYDRKLYPEIKKKEKKVVNNSNNKKRRLNKIYGMFDLDEGIVIEPAHEVFQSWITETVADIKHAFLLQNKQLSTDIICEVDPEFNCVFDDPLLTIERYKLWQDILQDCIEEVEDSYKFFHVKILPNKSFMMDLKKKVEYCNIFSELRNVSQLEQIISGLLDAEQQLIRWPRNIFHKVTFSEKPKDDSEKVDDQVSDEIVDFVLELRFAIEEALKYLRSALDGLKKRVVEEINNKVFSEIQEKWAEIHKNDSISRDDSKFIESRLLLYANIAQLLFSACPDVLGDVKGSLEVLTSVYRALNDKSNYIRVESLETFNKATESIGLAGVTFDPEDMQYEEEDEEEEAPSGLLDLMDMMMQKPKKKKKKKTKAGNKQTFNDNATQTMTDQEEELERKREEEKRKKLEEEKEKENQNQSQNEGSDQNENQNQNDNNNNNETQS